MVRNCAKRNVVERIGRAEGSQRRQCLLGCAKKGLVRLVGGWRLGRRGGDAANRPNEAQQLAGDGHDRLLGQFATRQQAAVFAVQACLGLPAHLPQRWGLRRLPLAQRWR